MLFGFPFLQVQQNCISCGFCMGEYYCSICKFFDDDVSCFLYSFKQLECLLFLFCVSLMYIPFFFSDLKKSVPLRKMWNMQVIFRSLPYFFVTYISIVVYKFSCPFQPRNAMNIIFFITYFIIQKERMEQYPASSVL